MATGWRLAALTSFVLGFSGCASKQEPTEYDLVLKRAKPPTQEALNDECSWINTSIERQRSLAKYVAATSSYPSTALAHQDAAQRNVAVLQSRAQQIGCQPASSGMSFDACFARCREHTQRSSDQCFDACNK
ncbi:MAG TPA: hypothetical protein VFJ70_04345 [Burkholderiales bacterium]|nr:hypothetical protein [Burkholderiales bacterium]